MIKEGLIKLKYKGLTLSDFQIEAIEAIKNNENVIVSTHTGNGKTLIADYAVNLCRNEGKQVIYTAPIKALSNQKFLQFKKEFGEETVGLITGDRVINDKAPILIMTTEILRNMMHEDPHKVDNIKYIIFDEIHYLNDVERGTVWEESIIFKQKGTKIIGLSATIPNIEELCDWMEYIHSQKFDKVLYPERIVKQKHFYFDKKLGPSSKKEIVKAYYADEDFSKTRTTHVDFVRFSQQKQILPILFFIFSRRQCEEKAIELASEFDFLNKDEKKLMDEIFNRQEERYPILQGIASWENIKNIVYNGICYHHAGLIPIIKEVVEELFEKRLIKVLYATETFAVGINYPVKTVCFDSLRKFDGKNFRPLKGSEYLQMSGRAGRRGIDDFGYVYSLIDYKFFNPNEMIDFSTVKSERVESQFKLTYNTILNLASRYTKEQIDEIFRKSLANYQYINTLNIKYKELESLKEKLQSFSGTNTKNTCKHFNTEVCPIVQQRLRTDLRDLINLSRKRGLSKDQSIKIKREIGEIQIKLKGTRFKKCSKSELRKCSADISEISRLKTTIKKIDKVLVRLTNSSPEKRFSTEYDEKLKLLEQFGYIKGGELLPRGETCSKIHVQELLVTEMIYEGLFHELDEDRLNAFMCGIVFEDDRPMKSNFNHHFDYSKISEIIKNVSKKESKLGIEPSATFIESACPIMYEWSRGCSLENITSNTELLEGDFVALCRRIMDLFRQVKNAYRDDKSIITKINNCISKINRDVVELGL